MASVTDANVRNLAVDDQSPVWGQRYQEDAQTCCHQFNQLGSILAQILYFAFPIGFFLELKRSMLARKYGS